jgi:hypothetical protein
MHKAFAPAVALACGVTLAGGVATAASTATSSPTVKACRATKSGALTLLAKGKCPTGSKPVTLSSRGPQGIQGIQGPQGTPGTPGGQGIQGNPGQNGAVAGFSVIKSASTTVTNSTTTIATLNLPAGSFLVSSKEVVGATNVSDTSVPAAISCALNNGSTTDTSQFTAGLSPVFLTIDAATSTISNEIAITLAAAGSVTLKCTDSHNAAPANYSATVSNARVSAVQTSANTVSGS